jgi:outer membrane protein assembly factor BamB
VQQLTRATTLALVVTVLTSGLLATQASARPAAASGAIGDWTTFLHDNGRSGFNASETAINPQTAASLRRAWSVRVKGAISTQAIVANGLVYWGSWDGFEHATDVSTGKEAWRTKIGSETKPDCYPKHIGVASNAA